MRTRTRSTTHLLAALLATCGILAACAGHGGSPPPVVPTVPTVSPTAAEGPLVTDEPSAPAEAPAAPQAPDAPAPAVPPEQVSTADYKVLASALYRERAAIENQMTTIARESAPASTRVDQIDGQLLPALRHLLGEAEVIQPEDAQAADLHQHLLTSLRTTIAAYQDLSTGLSQNDAAALARGRAELSAETNDLAIWVHGVPSL